MVVPLGEMAIVVVLTVTSRLRLDGAVMNPVG
jgi:hypothetical protein